ncbi:GNAT family N-acetyltransferase [Jannaschia ovalis]|uniref:GNAT family N-acetyltransferase n=1 Tax=Jannaschia ovalis TaxID=3038773 RepID=A0ABY8LIM3_9RHOB|nr:GNAT family N-acetyltransferase [Jannaschia sp. GRR-S6-38]WGH80000.1 GNAT family N-acetyltransferase [Jannaschia sp. GRR-S6-38]
MTPPVIRTERLTLRPLGLRDFEALAAFYASPRSGFVGGPMDRAQVWRHLACEIGHWTLRGYGRFAVDETTTDAFVGVVGPWNPEGWPEPELGWDLMDGHEGRGYATEAARAARDWAYSTGWRTAISLVAHGNDASARVATRLGCVFERDMEHARFGAMQVWRHPAPAEVTP